MGKNNGSDKEQTQDLALEIEYSDELCPYEFTEKEKAEIIQELAQSVTEVERLEEEKKAVMDDYKSQITAICDRMNCSSGYRGFKGNGR